MSGPLPRRIDDVKLELLLDAVARGLPQTMIARGSSMWPALRDGDRVELSPCKGRVALGSVVAVRPRTGGFLIHRVCGVRAHGAVLLKGDNNPKPDGWFEPAEVMAIVLRLDRGRGLQPVPSRAEASGRLVRFGAHLHSGVQRLRGYGTMRAHGGR